MTDEQRRYLTTEIELRQQLAECEQVLVQTRLLASEKLAEKNKRIAELEDCLKSLKAHIKECEV